MLEASTERVVEATRQPRAAEGIDYESDIGNTDSGWHASQIGDPAPIRRDRSELRGRSP